MSFICKWAADLHDRRLPGQSGRIWRYSATGAASDGGSVYHPPSADLDVNVPAKAEVRFKDAAAVRSLLVGALSAKIRDASIMAPPIMAPLPSEICHACSVKLHIGHSVTDRQAICQPVAVRYGDAPPICRDASVRLRFIIPSKVMIYLPITPNQPRPVIAPAMPDDDIYRHDHGARPVPSSTKPHRGRDA